MKKKRYDKTESFVLSNKDYFEKLIDGTLIHNHQGGSSFSLVDFKLAHKARYKMYVKVINSSQIQPEGFYVFFSAHIYKLGVTPQSDRVKSQAFKMEIKKKILCHY